MNEFCTKALGLHKIAESQKDYDENDSWQMVSVNKSLGSSSQSERGFTKSIVIIRENSSLEIEIDGRFAEIAIQKKALRSVGDKHAHLNGRHLSHEVYDDPIS